MLYELQKAIMTRFNSAEGATLRGLVQSMWEDEAPSSVVLATQSGKELKDSTLPFIVFMDVTASLDRQNFCSNTFAPIIQFTIFDDGNNKTSSRALLVSNAFLDLFGDQLLSMDNGYTMIRNDTVDQRKFKDGDKMWNVIVSLEFEVEKDR